MDADNHWVDNYWRYKPILHFINTHTFNSILEVGCFEKGITQYLKRRIVGVDVNFGMAATGLLEKVKATCHLLPFKDNSFDVVLSTDMLEHIPQKTRKECIEEIIRVAKKFVLLGIPCGQKSERADKDLNDFYKRLYKTDHRWLAEHIKNGLPSHKEIRQNLEKFKYKEIKNVPIFIWKKMLKLQFFLALDKVKGGFLINRLIYKLFAEPLSYISFGDAYRTIFLIEKVGAIA